MERLDITDEMLCQVMKSLDEKILNALPDEEEVKLYFSNEFEQKMSKVLKREKQRHKYGFPIESWKRIVAMFAVMIIGLLTVTLSVDAIREKVFSCIETIYDTYTSKHFYIEEASVGGFVPMYPSYIPEGYTLAIEDVEEDGLFLSYETKDGKNCILISQDLIYDHMYYTYDNEYTEEYTNQIQEVEAKIGRKSDGTIRVRWEKNGIIYLVSATNLPEDDVIKVCELLK